MPGKGKSEGSTQLTLGEEGHLVLGNSLQHSFQIDKRFPPVWSHCAGQDKFGTSTEFQGRRVFLLPERNRIKSCQTVHPSPCSFLKCSVTLTFDDDVEHNIILSKINSHTGIEKLREVNSGMKP